MPNKCRHNALLHRHIVHLKVTKRSNGVAQSTARRPRPSHNHLTSLLSCVPRLLQDCHRVPATVVCDPRTPVSALLPPLSSYALVPSHRHPYCISPSPLHCKTPSRSRTPSPFRHCPLSWSDFFPPRDYPVLSPHIHCTSLSNPRARPVYVRSAPTVGSTPHQGSLHTDCLPAWLAPLGGPSLAPSSSSSSTIATTAATRCTPVTSPTPLHNYLFTLSPPTTAPPIAKSTSTFFTTSHI